MQAFKYKGVQAGQKVEGEVVAGTIEEAERRLAAQDVTVIALLPAKRSGTRVGNLRSQASGGKGGRRRIPLAHLATMLHDLGVMAAAGVPFVEALDAVADAAPSEKLRQTVLAIRDEVVSGKSLSVALRAAEAFPDVVCELVHVAEEGGRLDFALRAASSYLERVVEMRKRIVNALLYPMVLLSVAVITSVVLVVIVLPKFSAIFDRMGADIPVTTKWMLLIGEALRSNPVLTVSVVIGLIFAIRWLWKLAMTSRTVSGAILRIPVLGNLVARLALARAFQSIATLISSNVPLLDSVRQAANVSGNPVIREALLNSCSGMEHGVAFSDALKQTEVIPKTLVQMVAVGERTGQLPKLMAASAEHMEQDVDGRLKALVSIVEPVMVVVMGALVGLITLSIIIPIYTVVQNIR
ncbi:MAG: hypothetical protein C4342_08550 [Armatimonadota bacterium]